MRHRERGFTTIEMIVVVAIVAVLANPLMMSLLQVMKSNESALNRMNAVSRVQYAGFWISRDTSMAQTIAGDDPETTELEFITLKWSNFQNGDVHRIAYIFEDADEGLKKLRRYYFIHSAEGTEILNRTIYIADGIVDSAAFQEQGGVWRLSISSRSGSETVCREYQTRPRVNM
jgi:prepilin-type N-terminal cleavage/methylation domain-containing protein